MTTTSFAESRAAAAAFARLERDVANVIDVARVVVGRQLEEIGLDRLTEPLRRGVDLEGVASEPGSS